MSMKTLPVLPTLCCTTDASPLSEPEAEELAARFKALADPTRVAIVNRLSGVDCVCVCDLTAAFDL
jgi:ArsR family transcriptional regulator, arsenate/arsenite/antimonite-responsive transcriptional repressor